MPMISCLEVAAGRAQQNSLDIDCIYLIVCLCTHNIYTTCIYSLHATSQDQRLGDTHNYTSKKSWYYKLYISLLADVAEKVQATTWKRAKASNASSITVKEVLLKQCCLCYHCNLDSTRPYESRKVGSRWWNLDIWSRDMFYKTYLFNIV